MDARATPLGSNRILNHLSSKTLALIEPHLRKVSLEHGAILHEAGQTITSVYFPLSGMVSMLAVLKTGEAIEAGVICREGFVGGYLGPRGWRSFGHAVMQMSGEVMRLNVRQFKKAYAPATICTFWPTVINRSSISRRSRPPPARRCIRSSRASAAGCCTRRMRSAAIR